MRPSAMLFALAAAAMLVSAHGAALAPAPAGPATACTLPNGQGILAPQASGTAQQWITYYYTYRWSYYSTWYYSWSWGRKLLSIENTVENTSRKLLQKAPAPAPASAASKCCPPTTTKQGDTVESLISAASLPADSRPFFYAMNPSIKNGTDLVPAGMNVTLPCYRITQYYYLLAQQAGAPAPAAAVDLARAG